MTMQVRREARQHPQAAIGMQSAQRPSRRRSKDRGLVGTQQVRAAGGVCHWPPASATGCTPPGLQKTGVGNFLLKQLNEHLVGTSWVRKGHPLSQQTAKQTEL